MLPGRSDAAGRARAASDPGVRASAAILVDAASGQVLWARNPDTPRPPASTTKIMTAILLLEHTQPDELITASPRAAATEGSSLNLKPGEQITARDLLYALMLRSANDACVALAEHVAGSEAEFARMMTDKAREIGATSTVFQNANGLNEPPNVTTARDLATMARYAIRFPEFNAATRSKYAAIHRSSGSRDVVLKNHARLLWKFAGADGIKTGYTNPAGRCFVGSATWNGWRLISVVLNSPDVVGETSRLLKHGFTRFAPHRAGERGKVYGTAPVADGVRPSVEAAAERPIPFVAPRGIRPEVALRPRLDPVKAPLPVGAPVGALEAWVNGRKVGEAPLVATAAVERAPGASASSAGRTFALAALMGSVVIGYGTAFAKGARRRRNRIAEILRRAHRRGQGGGQWPPGH